LIRKSASLAYAGFRTPLTLVENRLPENSKLRTGLHVALRTVDSSVHGLLGRSQPESAAPPAGGAQPSATIDTSQDAPAPTPDVEAEREAIAEAVRERQPDVGELADPELDVAEVQAQLQAKHAVELHEEEKQHSAGGADR
jgi:hypothetical protein